MDGHISVWKFSLTGAPKGRRLSSATFL